MTVVGLYATKSYRVNNRLNISNRQLGPTMDLRNRMTQKIAKLSCPTNKRRSYVMRWYMCACVRACVRVPACAVMKGLFHFNEVYCLLYFSFCYACSSGTLCCSLLEWLLYLNLYRFCLYPFFYFRRLISLLILGNFFSLLLHSRSANVLTLPALHNLHHFTALSYMCMQIQNQFSSHHKLSLPTQKNRQTKNININLVPCAMACNLRKAIAKKAQHIVYIRLKS